MIPMNNPSNPVYNQNPQYGYQYQSPYAYLLDNSPANQPTPISNQYQQTANIPQSNLNYQANTPFNSQMMYSGYNNPQNFQAAIPLQIPEQNSTCNF